MAALGLEHVRTSLPVHLSIHEAERANQLHADLRFTYAEILGMLASRGSERFFRLAGSCSVKKNSSSLYR